MEDLDLTTLNPTSLNDYPYQKQTMPNKHFHKSAYYASLNYNSPQAFMSPRALMSPCDFISPRNIISSRTNMSPRVTMSQLPYEVKHSKKQHKVKDFTRSVLGSNFKNIISNSHICSFDYTQREAQMMPKTQQQIQLVYRPIKQLPSID